MAREMCTVPLVPSRTIQYQHSIRHYPEVSNVHPAHSGMQNGVMRSCNAAVLEVSWPLVKTLACQVRAYNAPVVTNSACQAGWSARAMNGAAHLQGSCCSQYCEYTQANMRQHLLCDVLKRVDNCFHMEVQLTRSHPEEDAVCSRIATVAVQLTVQSRIEGIWQASGSLCAVIFHMVSRLVVVSRTAVA
jgi:hypothetical protein